MALNRYKKAQKGKYIPINPHKWSNPNNIRYLSSIEYRYMKYFDMHPDVIKIASEQIIIPYVDPLYGYTRRYMVDLLVQFRDKNGSTKTFLIEIKSYNETKPPKQQKKITENYKQKVYTYAVNQAKWTAAQKYCEKRGWVFKVFSEKDFN